jgi:hypothetical protein
MLKCWKEETNILQTFSLEIIYSPIIEYCGMSEDKSKGCIVQLLFAILFALVLFVSISLRPILFFRYPMR